MTHNNLIKSNKKEEKKSLKSVSVLVVKEGSSKSFTSRTASLLAIFLMYFENDLK